MNATKQLSATNWGIDGGMQGRTDEKVEIVIYMTFALVIYCYRNLSKHILILRFGVSRITT